MLSFGHCCCMPTEQSLCYRQSSALTIEALLPASVAALPEKSAFKEKRAKPTHASGGHQLINMTLVPGPIRCDSGHPV